MSQSPPPPSQHLAPFLSRFSRRKTLVHSIQKGEAPSVGEEVSDLAPLRSGQFAQTSLDLGLRPDTIVELPVGPEQAQMRHGNGPRPVRDVPPVQTPQSPWTKRHGRLKPNHARRFLASCLAQPRCRRSRPSPRATPLDATPVPARVERLESYGRDPAHAPRRTPRGQLSRRSWAVCWTAAAIPLARVGDRELKILQRSQLLLPRLGLAVAGVVTKDRGHARRLDADQGRSPPKKISSRAKVWTFVAHFWSSTFRTAPARFASALTQRPIVEWSGAWPGGKRIWNRSSV